jgi:hypothetical protein
LSSYLILSNDLMGTKRCWTAMPLGRPLLNILDRMNIGGVLLDDGGGVVDINGSARRLLNGKANGPGNARSPEEYQHAVRELLSRGTCRHRSGQESWCRSARGPAADRGEIRLK